MERQKKGKKGGVLCGTEELSVFGEKRMYERAVERERRLHHFCGETLFHFGFGPAKVHGFAEMIRVEDGLFVGRRGEDLRDGVFHGLHLQGGRGGWGS